MRHLLIIQALLLLAVPCAAQSHMQLTPMRAAAAGDSARAAAVVADLRVAIAKYRDVRVAVADGYRPFLPNVPQRVYHFTNRARALRSAFTFDPARPAALLYERTPTGLKLIGAMYTAPYGASAAELDARVPLSIAHWHVHTNICLPPRAMPALWRARAHGRPLFGPAGAIDTRAECRAAGGRFVPHLFGWMLHVYPWAEPGEQFGAEVMDHGSGMAPAP